MNESQRTISQRLELSKWSETIKLALVNKLAYKVNFLLIVLGPSIVFFIIKYNLWSAIFNTSSVDVIRGYSLETMIEYQMWTLIIALIGKGHTSMNLAVDIRLGKISTYLIYPFNFWQYHTSQFMASQLMQTLSALAIVALAFLLNVFVGVSLVSFLQGFVLTLVVSLFWFACQYLIGTLAFWLDETWVLRVILITITSFLSGSLLPLEIFPDWFASNLFYTPFPYLTYIPVKTFMGESPVTFLKALINIILWSLPLVALCAFVWRQGLKKYTGAGM